MTRTDLLAVLLPLLAVLVPVLLGLLIIRLLWGRVEVLASWNSFDQDSMQRQLDEERGRITRRDEQFWMVEPVAAVWVPHNVPCGRNQTRLVIAPVGLKRRERVIVLRLGR